MAAVITRRLCSRNVSNSRYIFNFSRVVQTPSVVRCSSKLFRHQLLERRFLPFTCTISTKHPDGPGKVPSEDEAGKKLSLFKRFKQMYRDYWYVLVPVHVVTSAAWFGGFYYLAKSGIDVVSLLESWNMSEIIIRPLKVSSMGYIAVSYALYKIATPIRYMVTLGGTTLSIKYLKEWGYIKPVPTTQQLKDMYIEQKENIMETMRGQKDSLKLRSDQLKEKRSQLMGGLEKSIKMKIADTKGQLNEKKEDILEELQKPLKIKRKDH